MKYEKQVEIVLVVKVEAEDVGLEAVTSESVGVAIVSAFDQLQVSMPTLEPFQVSVKRISTESDRPWSQAISYLAKAKNAIGLAWDAVRQG